MTDLMQESYPLSPEGALITCYWRRRDSLQPTVQVRAIVDTGAQRTAVAGWVIARLEAAPAARIEGDSILYPLRLVLPLDDGRGNFDISVLGADMEQLAFDCVIGRDMLSALEFTYNGRRSMFVVAARRRNPRRGV